MDANRHAIVIDIYKPATYGYRAHFAAGDQHMRIFSRLARRIMHEAFRHALVTADSSEAIAGLLQRELEL